MVQFTSYLRRVLCKTRLIFPRINGPIVIPLEIASPFIIYRSLCHKKALARAEKGLL